MGKVRVEKVDDRIWMKGSYEDCGPHIAKEIHGYSFRGTEKVWTYPLTLQTCRELRSVFGDKLEIGPDLTEWAWQAINHEETMSTLGKAMDAELTVVQDISPTLYQAMATRTYQRSGARFIATGKRVLLADEMGLGKSATALAGIMEAGAWYGDHIVVAPKTSIFSTWKRQIELWAPGTAVFAMPSGAAKRLEVWEQFRDSRADTKFLIVNPAMMRMKVEEWCEECEAWIHKDSKLNKPEHYYFRHKTQKDAVEKCDWQEIILHPWNSAIIDECHEHFSQYKPSNVTQTMEGLARVQPDIRIALTGTPLRGSEKKLWGTYKWLGVIQTRGGKHTGYWGWIETWFDVDKDGFGWTIKGLKEEKTEEFYKHIDTYTRRLTKIEARPDLPDKMYIPVWVELEGKHRKQYRQFLSAGELTFKTGTVASVGTLSELTRLLQLSFGVWDYDGKKLHPTKDSPKTEWIMQALKERGITGNPKEDFFPEEGSAYKYVIASKWTEVIDAVANTLESSGIKTLRVTGAVTGNKRSEVIEKFQSDDKEYRVLLINTKTGGVSIDLDAWCDEMFILDETWVADDQAQLEGRIDNRSGRVSPRTFYYVRTEETIEEEVAQGNYSQDELQRALLDNRRGVEIATRIITNTKERAKKNRV